MTLRQSSFGRPTRQLSIEDHCLRLSHSFLTSRYTVEFPLADIREKVEEYRHMAWSWYFVGASAIAFLGYYLHSGSKLGPPGVLFAVVYVSLGIYSLSTALRRSGEFAVLRIDGKRQRVLAIRRQIPNRFAVDAFLAELMESIRQEKERMARQPTPVVRSESKAAPTHVRQARDG